MPFGLPAPFFPSIPSNHPNWYVPVGVLHLRALSVKSPLLGAITAVWAVVDLVLFVCSHTIPRSVPHPSFTNHDLCTSILVMLGK